MLVDAVKARLPLIAVQSNDPLNVPMILETILEHKVVELGEAKYEDVRYILCDPMNMDDPPDWHTMFVEGAEAGQTIIVINPPELHYSMYDAGQLHLPEKVLDRFLSLYADPVTYELKAALRGLSYKELVEVAKLASARYQEFSAAAVLSVRREQTVLSSGLKLVNTDQAFYSPEKDLLDWLRLDGTLWTAQVDPIIMPRGLLFYGTPGTGKTSGAKFIASKLKVPLYSLDIGGVLQKYVGESERNLGNALTQLDQLAPCVLLFDEIEKLFDERDDSGVTTRILGMLLWWLQEHTSQVLTIMTTNDRDMLPPELVRPGRIDQSIEFSALTSHQGYDFATRLAKKLSGIAAIPPVELDHSILGMFNKLVHYRTQAEITQQVLHLLKIKVLKHLQLKE